MSLITIGDKTFHIKLIVLIKESEMGIWVLKLAQECTKDLICFIIKLYKILNNIIKTSLLSSFYQNINVNDNYFQKSGCIVLTIKNNGTII